VVISVQFKILFLTATVTGLFWWFSAWAGRKVPTLQVQRYPSPVAVVPKPKPVASAVTPLPAVATPQPVPKPVVLQARPLAIDPITNQILDALMSAVISQESSGNPDLQHPVSKAMGLGQVMPANIPSWTKETFGQELTTEQFKNSPDAQMYVIRQKLFEYYARAIAASGGDLHMAVRRVGAQWYSGQSDLYDSTKPVATGPNIRDYTLQVLSRFQNFYPQNYLVRY
jgi:Transglycosylase SLT domain